MYTKFNPLNRLQREPITATGALVAGGASLLGQGASAYAQGRMNKATREWNEKMYARQKADNLEFWNMQNSFNSPQAQMARFQEAGLNPNLMYGQGTNGNASSLSAPSAMPYKPNAPDFSPESVVNEYYNTQLRGAQVDNVKKQGDLMALDGLLKMQDIKSKSLLNDYMGEYGYIYRRNKEKAGSNLAYETWLSKVGQNLFNFGDQNAGDNAVSIKDGSAYDLQSKGLDLINKLRSTQNTNQGHVSDINKIRSDYQKRISSGNLSDMGSKDFVQLIMQAIGLFK